MFSSTFLHRMSTSTVHSTRKISSEPAGKQRVSLALYRQLLRWCAETEKDIPLSFFIPPVYMKEPQIDVGRLSALSDKEKSFFPSNSILEANHITCPIHNSEDARKFFRGVFRVNQASTEDPQVQKQRVTLAFEGIRSLNTLSQGLHGLKLNRAKHVLRDGVDFRVGQVVKHKIENWRGIIIAWRRVEPNRIGIDAKPTSLTKKQYDTDSDESIIYTVLIDSGDAHLHYSKRRESSNLSRAEVHQTEIELVQENSLLRIRNTQSSQFFKCFDSSMSMFLANEVLAYEYPNDIVLTNSAERTTASKSEDASEQIAAGAEDMSDHLRSIILDYTSAPELRKLKILKMFLERTLKISSGDVLPVKDRMSAHTVSTRKLAAAYLQSLISLSEDIGDLLWQRRRYMQSAEKMNFSVGEIVKHTEYGFRGVIVAADPEPAVDVSQWDGLQHIKSPETYPFYHIIPDQQDCVKAFGGGRPSRYVCEANLVACPTNEKAIDVDLGPEWERDVSRGVYIPPDDVKFKYGIDLGDNGITKGCLMELRDSLTRTLVAMRDGSSSGRRSLDTAAEKLCVSNLMEVLKDAEDLEMATTVSDSLKEIWRVHINGDLKYRFDEATNALLCGKTEHALALFTDLIDEDPNYAEAWNKASTCEFMLGNLDASMGAAQKTLDILPGHFQAQNGLGLVYFEKKDFASAIECFRKSLELDPWSPVSARLTLCLDTIEKWEKSPGPKSL